MRRIASLLVLLPLLGARVGAQLPRSVQVTCSDFPELSGTFTLRPERENDSELYYKPTVFGDETNPETFNFLYRSGNPGRWILVRGLTAMRERQGDLLSEQDNLRGGPFGLVWLKAVGIGHTPHTPPSPLRSCLGGHLKSGKRGGEERGVFWSSQSWYESAPPPSF